MKKDQKNSIKLKKKDKFNKKKFKSFIIQNDDKSDSLDQSINSENNEIDKSNNFLNLKNSKNQIKQS